MNRYKMSSKEQPPSGKTTKPALSATVCQPNGSPDAQAKDDIPVVTISPTLSQELPHIDSFPNLRHSPSNLSLDRGLTASPIPWRDASMEVLVSPNDGPQISIEDYDSGLFDDSPFQSGPPFRDFDTVSMCDMNPSKNHSRLYSENSAEPLTNGIDKTIDRKMACYGVSPRLPRKSNDFLFCDFTPIKKDSRPKTLDLDHTSDKTHV